MLLRLFLLFTLVPIVEIWLLISVGRVIGPLPTVGALLVVSLAGAWLARSQGMNTILAIRDELAHGRLPADRLLDGALILAGGILLLTPGFFTDVVGLFFLIPVCRGRLKVWLRSWFEARLRRGAFVVRRW